MDVRTVFLLIVVSASCCDVTTAQFRPSEEGGGSEDYFFESPRRADDEESESTAQDPDGDGVIGAAGKDYPVLRRPPEDTRFTCNDKLPGIYADMDTGCQVYHICQSDQRMESSLCVNGTVFNQEALACDWWYNVDCSSSHRFYWLNEELGKQPAPRRGPLDFLGPPKTPQHPPTSFTIDFPPPPLKKVPSPPPKKLPPQVPQQAKKTFKDKPRPHQDVTHYGREAFDPALNVPPRPKNLDKKLSKQQQLKLSSGKSPLTVPVNSDDVVAGYSDLYLNKPVDED